MRTHNVRRKPTKWAQLNSVRIKTRTFFTWHCPEVANASGVFFSVSCHNCSRFCRVQKQISGITSWGVNLAFRETENTTLLNSSPDQNMQKFPRHQFFPGFHAQSKTPRFQEVTRNANALCAQRACLFSARLLGNLSRGDEDVFTASWVRD